MPNFKKVPIAFLLAMLMIVIFETCNYVFDNYFYSVSGGLPIDMAVSEGLRMNIKNEISQAKGNSFDILVLGDSYNTVGVIPKVIEEKTGLSCYNFSTHKKHTILATYCMFRHYLNTCSKKPKYIVVSFLPMTYGDRKIDIIKESLPFLYEFRNGNVSIFIKEFGLAQGMMFLIPSLKHQDFFQSYFNKQGHLKRVNKKELADYFKQVAFNNGYYPWYINEVYNGEAKDGEKHSRIRESLFFRKYLKAILDMANKNNIVIIYIIPTFPPDVYKIQEENRFTEQYCKFVDTLAKDYSNLTIVKPQSILNKKDFYVDRYHLNKNGAALLSNFLSNKINEFNDENLQL